METAAADTFAPKRVHHPQDRAPTGPQPVGPAIYTMQETSHFLRCHLSTLYRMMNSGELATLKIRGRRMVKRSEINRILGE